MFDGFAAGILVVDFSLHLVKAALSKDCPSVIISRRPCALLKNVKHPSAISCDTDKCVGCRSCMQIGCPAISIRDKKAYIDGTLCVGCGVCAQLCRFGALPERKEF